MLLAGCQMASGGVNSILSTEQGLKVEAFLPQDTLLLFKVGPTDQQQHDALDNLLSRFPAKDQQSFGGKLIEGIDKDLKDYGLTYETDIVPLTGDKAQMVLALAGTPFTTDGSPDLYAFVPLQDPAKADAVLQKLLQNHAYSQEIYGTHTLYSKTGGGEFMAVEGDLLIVTSGEDVLKNALDRQQMQQASLLDNQAYIRSLREFQPSVLAAYFNVQQMLVVLKQDSASRTKVEEVFGQFPGGDFLNSLQAGMFYVKAEDKGLRLYGAIFGDDDRMKALPQNFSSFPVHAPYLDKKVPGGDVLAYFEGYNPAKALGIELGAWENVPGFSNGLDLVKQDFAGSGLDFDKDFAPLFEQGVAVAINYNGSVVPAAGLYADVQGHTDEAGKVMGQLKNFVDYLLNDLETKSPDMNGLLTNDQATVAGGPAYVLRLHPDQIKSTDKNLALLQLFITKPVEFWYGITGDQVAFLAFEPDFDKQYQGSAKVQNDQNFRNMMEQLADPQAGVGFISPSSFAGYFDTLVGLSQIDPNNILADSRAAFGSQQSAAGGAGAGDSQEVDDDYNDVRAYFKPITGAGFTVQPVSAGESRLEGFVQIQ
jgi:hypothetical protein